MKKAFTLIEIMVVVAIIGLLSAMAIPAFQKVRAASIEKQRQANVRYDDNFGPPRPQTPTSPKEITIDGRRYRLVEQ